MKTFEKICENCWLVTWNNKGGLLTTKQANLIGFDLFANGLLSLEELREITD
jgi:hypothetical protein